MVFGDQFFFAGILWRFVMPAAPGYCLAVTEAQWTEIQRREIGAHLSLLKLPRDIRREP